MDLDPSNVDVFQQYQQLQAGGDTTDNLYHYGLSDQGQQQYASTSYLEPPHQPQQQPQQHHHHQQQQQQQQQQQVAAAAQQSSQPIQRRKQWVSCDACRYRKVKCDRRERLENGHQACSVCVNQNIDCTFTYQPPKKRNGRRLQELQKQRKQRSMASAMAETLTSQSLPYSYRPPSPKSVPFQPAQSHNDSEQDPNQVPGKTTTSSRDKDLDAPFLAAKRAVVFHEDAHPAPAGSSSSVIPQISSSSSPVVASSPNSSKSPSKASPPEHGGSDGGADANGSRFLGQHASPAFAELNSAQGTGNVTHSKNDWSVSGARSVNASPYPNAETTSELGVAPWVWGPGPQTSDRGHPSVAAADDYADEVGFCGLFGVPKLDRGLLDACCRAYFQHAGVCTPLVRQEIFWPRYHTFFTLYSGQPRPPHLAGVRPASELLILAVAARGAGNTAFARRFEIQTSLHKKFMLIIDDGGKRLSKMGMEGIEAIMIMSDIQIGVNRQPAWSLPNENPLVIDPLTHEASVRMLMKAQLHRSKPHGKALEGDDLIRQRNIFWALFILDAFRSCASRKMYLILDEEFDAPLPIQRENGPRVDWLNAFLSLAFITRKCCRQIVNQKTQSRGLDPKAVIDIIDAMNNWYRFLPPNLQWDFDDPLDSNGPKDTESKVRKAFLLTLWLGGYLTVWAALVDFGIEPASQNTKEAFTAAQMVAIETEEAYHKTAKIAYYCSFHRIADINPEVLRNLPAAWTLWGARKIKEGVDEGKAQHTLALQESASKMIGAVATCNSYEDTSSLVQNLKTAISAACQPPNASVPDHSGDSNQPSPEQNSTPSKGVVAGHSRETNRIIDPLLAMRIEVVDPFESGPSPARSGTGSQSESVNMHNDLEDETQGSSNPNSEALPYTIGDGANGATYAQNASDDHRGWQGSKTTDEGRLDQARHFSDHFDVIPTQGQSHRIWEGMPMPENFLSDFPGDLSQWNGSLDDIIAPLDGSNGAKSYGLAIPASAQVKRREALEPSKTCSAEMQRGTERSPEERLLKLGFWWRVYSIAALVVASLVQEPFDSSAELLSLTLDPRNEFGLLAGSWSWLKCFIRWDTIYFLTMASPEMELRLGTDDAVIVKEAVAKARGYAYEQMLAFQPGIVALLRGLGYLSLGNTSRLYGPVPLVWDPARSILLATILANLATLAAPLLLYRLTVLHTRSSRLGIVASSLAILAPSSGTTLSSPTPEPYFNFFALLGMLSVAQRPQGRSRARRTFGRLFAALCFAAATAFRANGVALAGFLLWDLVWVKDSDRVRTKPSRASLLRPIAVLFEAAILIPLSVAPFILTQMWAYGRFCRAGLAKRPWCDDPLPGVYTFVQEHYWNVGLFRYWEIGQLPNFVLAAPILLLSGYGMKRYATGKLGSISAQIIALGRRVGGTKADDDRTARGSAKVADPGSSAMVEEFRDAASLVPHLVLNLFLTLTLLVASHVQIALRFSSPGGMPFVWWGAACLYDSGPTSWSCKRWLLTYLVLYHAIAIVLYAGFYPPA